jgi:hypothetical protein
VFFSVQVFVKSSPPEKVLLSGTVSLMNCDLSQLTGTVALGGGVALAGAAAVGAWLGGATDVKVADGAAAVRAAWTVSAAAV